MVKCKWNSNSLASRHRVQVRSNATSPTPAPPHDEKAVTPMEHDGASQAIPHSASCKPTIPIHSLHSWKPNRWKPPFFTHHSGLLSIGFSWWRPRFGFSEKPQFFGAISSRLHAADRSDGAEGLEEAAQGVVIGLLILGQKLVIYWWFYGDQ